MRAASIALIVLISAANAVSAILLIRAILETLPSTAHAAPLLASGASIWATNVIAFGLWYWEFDRGGPVRRAEGTAQHPDLMFPQMASPELAPPGWEPYFVDYLYLSFTNATAFSPTDVMPLARWAKMTMAVQSAVSLAGRRAGHRPGGQHPASPAVVCRAWRRPAAGCSWPQLPAGSILLVTGE